jgi:4-carboxymuconolactone decarboxylase
MPIINEGGKTMCRPSVFAAFIGLMSVTNAQTPSTRDLGLIGGRFKPLTYDELTPEQKKMVGDLVPGQRGGLSGPFNVLLRSPEMGDLAQKLGAQLRFHSTLPGNLRELAILITARFWNSQYAWYAHREYARQEGVNATTLDAIAAGKRPLRLEADEGIVYNFCTELLNTKQVSDPTFRAAVDRFGERTVVELTSLIGFYNLGCLILNLDRYPLPDGVKPELRPLHGH